MLLTPPAPQLLLRGGRSSLEGCPGHDAELRSPEGGFGAMLVGVEFVHVPGIGDKAEDVPTVPKRCSHPGKAIQKSLGGLWALGSLLAISSRYLVV
jgi:hypothetical protein